MSPTSDVILAVVALINAIGGVVALIIHALRVPYRESNAVEARRQTDSVAHLAEVLPGAAEGTATAHVHPPSEVVTS